MELFQLKWDYGFDGAGMVVGQTWSTAIFSPRSPQ